MTAATQRIVDEVNAFLDTQTGYVQETLSRLDHLRASLIRRDEGALEKLFEQVQQENERKVLYDRALQLLRQKLAIYMGCPAQEVCLSRFCRQMEPDQQKAFSERQATLQGLIRRLGNEHRATESLLRECSRFNRLLLNSIFGSQNQTGTYDARGMSRWNVQGSLVNMRF